MEEKPKELGEVVRLFLRMGLTAYGGPAAHIGMFHDEVVKRRKWLTEQEFLDLLGATNLIPGPNSTEMAIHIGYERAGWPGLILGGACFILPAMVIVMILAAIYVRYGTKPQVEMILYGVKPVVIAIILQALWSLGRRAVKSWLLGLTGLTAFILFLFGFNEIPLMAAGGLLIMLIANAQRLRRPDKLSLVAPLIGLKSRADALWPQLAGIAAQVPAVPFSLPLMFLTFLKIGAVLYGSGYVLLAFLRSDFVLRFGWITDQQLLDAVAIGQVTPGPLFTTATFIGYLLGGVPAGLLATLGIFLPSFIFVALTNPIIPRMRHSVWVSGFLDGVNVTALGLMAGVTVQLARGSLVDPITVVIALVSLALLIWAKVNSTSLIAGGAAIGYLIYLIR